MSERRIAGRRRRVPGVERRRAGRWVVLPVWISCLSMHGAALSADWNSTASLSLGATATDNVFLARDGNEKSDVILRTSPSFGVTREGARLKFNGRYAPVFLGYVNGNATDAVINTLNATGTLEAVENFAFIDARAQITQSFLSPLGAQPTDVGAGFGNPNVNRTEVRTLGVSPYLRGRLPGGGSYQLRDDYTYTTLGRGSFADTVINRISASATDGPGSRVVMSSDYSYSDVNVGGIGVSTSQIGRLRATISPDQEISLSANAGYEHVEFGPRIFSGAVYGVSADWRPSPRTSAALSVEQRYFGTSYSLSGTHRTRMAAFTLRAFRTEQVFQQRSTQLESLDTRTLLDSSLSGSITNAADRAREVERLMQSTGLPSSVLVANAFVSSRVTRVEGFEPSVVVNGIFNTVLLSMFVRQTTPISDSLSAGLPDPFLTAGRIRQTGGSASVSHRLSENMSVLVGADLVKTRTGGAGTNGVSATNETRQTTIRATLTHTLSPATSASVGVRVLNINSNVIGDLRERAVLLTLSHTFR
jgi:uncharacterized protein (PEP-CTERM system associated)